jgi:hypothetical protein
VPRGVEVDRQHLPPVLLAHLRRRRAAQDAGVVHEHVEAADGLGAALHEPPGRVGVEPREVGLERLRSPAQGAHLLHGLPRRQHVERADVRARPRQSDGEPPPEAAGGPGDQAGAAREREGLEAQAQ